MTEKTYEKIQPIEYAFCDYRGEARLSYLLAMGQQVSMEHCDHAGIGDAFFRSRGQAFLLAKLRLTLLRSPRGGEQVRLFTAPNLPVRAQYRRRTLFLAATDGEVLAELDARWLLVDIASRRVLRRLPEGVTLPFLEAEELEDFRPAPPELLTPREEVAVRYSMVDINGHMNNTSYGDLVTNLLEDRLRAGERLREVELFYHREALPGAKLLLSSWEEGKRFFIRGTVEGANCFEAAGELN